MTHAFNPQPATVDAVFLLGPPTHDALDEADFQQFVQPVARRLGLPAAACFFECRDQSLLATLQRCQALGYRRIIVQPLALEGDAHQHEALYAALDWERRHYPQLDLRYADVLGVQPALVQALADRVAASLNALPDSATTVLVVGRGSPDAETNADLAKTARLLWEGRPYAWVESAYIWLTQPTITQAVERAHRLGAQQIICAPYWLTDRRGARLAAHLRLVQECYPALRLIQATALGDHAGVIEAIARRVREAAQGRPVARGHTHHHGGAPSFLPSRDQNVAPVSAAPMAAAPLVYDGDGRVAWDRIWGVDGANAPFCALALAGGPPHRAALLEPPTPAEVAARQADYGRVLAELTRGVQMTTGLPTQLSAAPGWLGVRCAGEAMAIWLLRAILAENVCVRREGEVLYVPAGPGYRLEHEIKNVITAVAKTHHYWQEHPLAGTLHPSQ
jgi:sirohydrochlorin cobaltochelatase